VISSYCAAFNPDEGMRLVLKVTTKSAAAELARRDLFQASADRADIQIISDDLTAPELRSLLLGAVGYVSLHRSEGLGINIFDAMAHGVPAIATGYGGNAEFLPKDYPLSVTSELTLVGHGNSPYPPESLWADPNLSHASELMQFVAQRTDSARTIAQSAREHLQVKHGLDQAAEIWLSFLQDRKLL